MRRRPSHVPRFGLPLRRKLRGLRRTVQAAIIVAGLVLGVVIGLLPGLPTSGPTIAADQPRICPAQMGALPLGRPSDVEGQARIIDGDTIDVSGRRIRFNGIDAPEMDTATGRDAKIALQSIVGRQPVRCIGLDVDRYGRLVARCVLPNDVDLAMAMLAAGKATAWARYLRGQPHASAYFEAEAVAKDAGCGIWSGN